MKLKKLGLAFLLVAAFAILGQTNAQAFPICTGPLSGLEAGPCQTADGSFTLSFKATTINGGNVTDADILTTVTNTGSTSLDVVFAPDAAVGFALGTSGALAQYNFHYTVSYAGVLTNAAINIDNATVTNVAGAVTGFKEIDTTFQITAGSQSGIGVSSLSGNMGLPSLVSPATIEDDNTIIGSGSSVGNGINHGEVENVLTFVPEPLTTVLVGAGLLGFGLFRKRLKR